MKHLDAYLILLALFMMLAGVAIALPTSASFNQILVGVMLCWCSLPIFWLAAQLQGLR